MNKMNTQSTSTQNENLTETAANLYAFLTQNQAGNDSLKSALTTPALLKLDPKIFPYGVTGRDVIEITGAIGIGKSELIMHLMSRCILPSAWKLRFNDTEIISIDLNDLSCLDSSDSLARKVILIETDAKFNVMRLFSIIENRLLKVMSQNEAKLRIIEKKMQLKMVKRFIYECLRDLIIYRCNSSEQLIYCKN